VGRREQAARLGVGAEYKYPVLGFVFLKYVSDLFDAQAEVIRQRLADPKSDIYIEDKATRNDVARSQLRHRQDLLRPGQRVLGAARLPLRRAAEERH
jgi:type I restriction-modification system DNA methylase subunit